MTWFCFEVSEVRKPIPADGTKTRVIPAGITWFCFEVSEVSEVSKLNSADNAGMTRFCFEVSEVGKP
ncbi:hypothetical protein QUF72_20175 [Desulfobacterales bacterium HSG2]|nr:hypothetical protein [Desulfobacterales bacterium HSG2]